MTKMQQLDKDREEMEENHLQIKMEYAEKYRELEIKIHNFENIKHEFNDSQHKMEKILKQTLDQAESQRQELAD